MRVLAKLLILTSAAAGVATLGVAGPAHASTVKCAQQSLRPEAPDILVVTCAEAEGDQRRGLSTVINNTDQAIELTQLQSLISFPEYGLTDCGASRLEPGAQVACISPWVPATRPWATTRAAAFSLVRVIEANGRYTTLAANIHATF
jgi:hypothetical protein